MLAPEVRLVLAVSLDGRLAPAHGGAAQLGGRGDRRALEEALCWADGCLIGGHTLRLHRTTCLIRDADLLEQRQRAGLPPQPLAVVVSRHGHFDQGLPFFSQPLRRGLLLSGAAAAAGTPPGFDLHWPLEAWPQTLGQLQAAGLQRLVLLGGANLAGQLLAAGVVQELQLTLCPQVLAGPHSWVQEWAMPAVPTGWQMLEHRAIGDGELLLRYRSPTAPRLTPDPCETAY